MLRCHPQHHLSGRFKYQISQNPLSMLLALVFLAVLTDQQGFTACLQVRQLDLLLLV